MSPSRTMSLKRPAETSLQGTLKRAKSPPLKLYLVPAKLPEGTLSSLRSQICEHDWLLLCNQPEEADVLVTVLGMQKRLQRDIDWAIAKHKHIVTPKWLEDSIHKGSPQPFTKFISIPSSAAQNSIPALPSAPEHFPLDYKSRFSCHKQTPLHNRNEELVSKFCVLRDHRELEGLEVNALSYDRAIAALRACPYKITEPRLDDIRELPWIGTGKMHSKVKEWVRKGSIEEAKEIIRSERHRTLSLFATVYGIGSKTARTLYTQGLRTLEDLRRHYYPPTRGVLNTAAYLALYDSLSTPIPRTEVEQIHATIMEYMEPGCLSMITGGYRRGKELCRDVDIVIAHPSTSIQSKLVKRLVSAELVTHVAQTRFNVENTVLMVFRLPGGIPRRVDLIFIETEKYWCAVVGWTGSKTFERDLRLFAKEKRGLRFDSYKGIIRMRDEKVLAYPRSEKEVFDALGMEWIEPTMRNA